MEQEKEIMKKKGAVKWVIAVIALVVLVGVFGAAYYIYAPKAQEGSKAITITVVDNEGEETVYEWKTDAAYLMEAVNEIEGLSLDGYDSDYGFFIVAVNGLEAVYENDNAYWALYVNGEYGNYGVDTQPVADGDTYRFVYEVAVTE